MNAAEYDTRRRALGLSVRELAAWHGCTERTVNRRIAGEQMVRDDDAADLDRLEDAMQRAVDEAVALATGMTAAGPVRLTRYRTAEDQARSPHASSLPLGAHAIMIGWAADALEAEGVRVEIVWADAAPA